MLIALDEKDLCERQTKQLHMLSLKMRTMPLNSTPLGYSKELRCCQTIVS